MFSRGWFSLSFFSFSLILSCPLAYAGDGTVSLIKTVGTWALKTVGKVAGVAIAGHAAQQYNANNFDVNTGTFRIPRDISENRGVPVGLQNSTTYETPAEIKAQRDYDNLPREQQIVEEHKYWEEKSKASTQRELDYWIETEKSLIKNAKDEANYRKHKGQTGEATSNETRAKEHEATKAILEKEKNTRQPRGHIVRQLSDGSLKKILRNKKEELAFAQKKLATEKKYWFPDEQKVADNEYLEKNLQGAIKQIEREQQNRTQKAVTHVVSTAMVMTSKTAGTDNKTKTTSTELVTTGNSSVDTNTASSSGTAQKGIINSNINSTVEMLEPLIKAADLAEAISSGETIKNLPGFQKNSADRIAEVIIEKTGAVHYADKAMSYVIDKAGEVIVNHPYALPVVGTVVATAGTVYGGYKAYEWMTAPTENSSIAQLEEVSAKSIDFKKEKQSDHNLLPKPNSGNGGSGNKSPKKPDDDKRKLPEAIKGAKELADKIEEEARKRGWNGPDEMPALDDAQGLNHIYPEGGKDGHDEFSIKSYTEIKELVSNPENFELVDKHGSKWYRKWTPEGEKWARAHGGKVKSGGTGKKPSIPHPEFGLIKEGSKDHKRYVEMIKNGIIEEFKKDKKL